MTPISAPCTAVNFGAGFSSRLVMSMTSSRLVEITCNSLMLVLPSTASGAQAVSFFRKHSTIKAEYVWIILWISSGVLSLYASSSTWHVQPPAWIVATIKLHSSLLWLLKSMCYGLYLFLILFLYCSFYFIDKFFGTFAHAVHILIHYLKVMFCQYFCSYNRSCK